MSFCERKYICVNMKFKEYAKMYSLYLKKLFFIFC